MKTSSVMADKTTVVLEDIKPGTYKITVNILLHTVISLNMWLRAVMTGQTLS